MPFKNGTKLCICEICNCGRHRCPHHPTVKHATGPCTLSEYTNKYIPHPLIPVPSCKPAAVAMHSMDPLSDETTTRIDYVPHPLQRVKVHHTDMYRPPEGKMDDTTVYNSEYTQKNVPKTEPIKHQLMRRDLGKFEGEPTYRNDYRRWALSKPDRAQTVVTWSPPKERFEGLPTYTSDYIGYTAAPQTSCKPDVSALHSEAPFEDMTDYRQSYVKHPLEGKLKPKDRDMWTKSAVPFDGLTTFKRDFTPKEGGKAGSCKPMAHAFQSGAPLQSDTTNRIDYKPWEVRRPFHHQADPYRIPDGDMDMNTTYLRDYPEHPFVKSLAIRPKDRGRNLDPFQGTTDYRDSYKKWNLGQKPHIGPNLQYHPPSVPFEGESTHHAHFIQHPLDPRKSCKPDPRAYTNGGEFDDGTIYRMEYTPKHVAPCPAALLESPRSRFVYKEQDTTGHKFYEPVSSTVTDLKTGKTFSTRESAYVPIAAS